MTGFHEDKNNFWAETSGGERVQITDVPSGRGDFFCPSCKNEVVAVHRKIPRKISFFRHHVLDLLKKKPCAYSDFGERMKVAEEILVASKAVNVPGVYKYPEDGSAGPAHKIAAAKLVQAYQVLRSQYIYIDSDDYLHYGRQVEIPGLTFLIKANIMFLDQTGNVMLVIILTEKHKINEELKKTMSLLRLNTIQISLPRVPKEEIAKIFERTNHTKWLFNKDYAKTKYTRISSGDQGGSSDPDELQNRFLEDDFYCKRNQIGRVIRKITNYLESQQYRDSRNALELAIERIEQEEREFSDGVRELQKAAEIEVREEYRRIEDELRSRRTSTAKSIEQITGEQRNIESELNSQLLSDRAFRDAVNSRKGEIEENIRNIKRDIEAGAGRIEKIRKDQEAAPRKFRSEDEELESDHRKSIERIGNRDMRGSSELSNRIREILEIGRTIDNYSTQQPTYVRYQKAWRSFNDRDYKNWNDA